MWSLLSCFHCVCSGTPSDHHQAVTPLPDKKTLELILDKLQKYGASVSSIVFGDSHWLSFRVSDA